MDREETTKMPHNIIMENRKNMSISGVIEVVTFDEQVIILHTQMGELTVKGNDLHISRFDIASGEFAMDGKIIALCYNDEPVSKSKANIFSKIFK